MEGLLTLLAGAALVLVLVWARSRLLDFMAQRSADYLGEGRDFELKRDLSGPMLCEGVIYGPTGRVTSRFVADVEAEWDGDRGTVREWFHYDSGATQHREWHLQLSDDGVITATAEDVVGRGRGRQMGSGVLLRYRIQLPADVGGHVLSTTDWMYMIDNGTIMNRSQFRKYGFKVAELVATIRKKETP